MARKSTYNEKVSEVIQIPVTKEQKNQIKLCADIEYMNIAQFCRSVLLKSLKNDSNLSQMTK